MRTNEFLHLLHGSRISEQPRARGRTNGIDFLLKQRRGISATGTLREPRGAKTRGSCLHGFAISLQSSRLSLLSPSFLLALGREREGLAGRAIRATHPLLVLSWKDISSTL
mmetsp:Transcript_70103/g.146619  ORF Transcript_70103/g.146619 Transcript_70103/m.146619 type:complete len:111 (+) Transcript_70103:202-534(+)